MFQRFSSSSNAQQNNQPSKTGAGELYRSADEKLKKGLYYYRQSWGIGTNLQLHSLRQAWKLLCDVKSKSKSLRDGRIRERCVVIVDLIGLSLSQLLGQNYASESSSVPSPRHLIELCLSESDLSDESKKRILIKFTDFLSYYDDCRHFGSPKHKKIDTLTLEKTDDFFSLAIEIWNLVCKHHDLEFDSIKNILDTNEDEEDVDEW